MQHPQPATDGLKKLSESKERFFQIQKLDAVDQLAGGLAHHLNSILAVIKGYNAILLEQPDIPPGMVEPLKLMASSTDRAARLMRQLLAYSGRLIMRTQRLDLNEVIGEITPALRMVLGQGIALRILHNTKAIEIDLDMRMIEEVILNIAANARDAMNSRGQFQLKVEPVNVDMAETQCNPEARMGRFICLSLADTGCGMGKDVLAHLFEPFYTTKDVGEGTGMGLAAAYGMVKQLQGWIEVDSVVGEGTRFRIFLPVAVEVCAPSVLPVSTAPLHSGQKTILVVDDEPEFLQMIAGVLKEEGYRVWAAANGVEALELWRLHRDQIDLLLTDIVMPKGISGIELANRLKAEQPGLKVIYTTGHGDTKSLMRIDLREGINYLPKPYLPSKMLQAVGACLENG